MEYRVDHELPTKDELKSYSKDTIDLMRQNIWLCIKLIVGGIIATSLVGLLITLPSAWGVYSLQEGISPDFLFFFYRGSTDFLRLVFSCVPLWLILYYTGFKLMESRKVVVPSGYVIRKQFIFLKHFWTGGILVACFAAFIILAGLMTTPPDFAESSKESVDRSQFTMASMIIYHFMDRGMELGIGFYWFPFIHIMIFSALLFGKESTPTISFTLKNLFFPKVPLNTRLFLFFIFVVVDLVESLLSLAIVTVLPDDFGYVVAVIFRALFFLFVAGILYCYCVDKIEGRKLKKKVKVESFSGNEMPSSA